MLPPDDNIEDAASLRMCTRISVGGGSRHRRTQSDPATHRQEWLTFEPRGSGRCDDWQVVDRTQIPDPLVGLALAMQSAPGRFALLVGSGISYAAGIPTGWAVVSDLAARIAIAEGESDVPDDPVAWYTERYGGSPDYSSLLEAVAPTPGQRRDLLSSYFEPTDEERESGLKAPTAAHVSIARLVRRGTVRLIITTNFDRLLEQAIQSEGIEPSVVATEAAARGTIPFVHSRCTIVKVHGDYLDPNIRNTIGELDAYEPALDSLLDRAFDDYGLVICGWSATWDPALRHAIERCPTRRYGTYWATRGALTSEAQRVAEHRVAEVISIADADDLFGGLVSKVEALNDLAKRSSTGVDVVAAEAKRYLPDPVHRIRLHDLAMDAGERALVAVDFDGNPPSSLHTDYLAKLAELEVTSAELVTVVAVIAQFANQTEHQELLRRLLLRVASPADTRLGGFTAWINLRGYPALLALYGVGVAATATENWPVLASTVSMGADDPLSDGDDQVPFPLRFAAVTVLDHDAIQSSFEPPGRKTPVSDHLHSYFDETLRPQLRLSEDQFSLLFDEWEYLLGVVIADARGRGPIGRFAWKNHGFGRSPDRALISAAPDLLGVGLFKQSEDHLATVRSGYDEAVSQSGLWF